MRREQQLAILDRIVAHHNAGNTTDMAPEMYVNSVDSYTDPERYRLEVERLFRGCPIVACLTPDVARPGDVTFSVVDVDCHGLAEVACGEAAGLVFVQIDLPGTIDANKWLDGMATELASFDLAKFTHFETRTSTRAMNWKLMVDTFCEQYHLRHLHHASFAPTVQSDNSLYDTFGLHGRMITPHTSTIELPNQPREEWALLRHAILNYMIVPNTVLLVQDEFVELFQLLPDGPERAISMCTMYSREAADTERARQRLRKAFDYLLDVVGREDYQMCEQTQRSFGSGAQRHLLFGRNEPGLIHFHQSVDALLQRSPTEPLSTA